MEQRYLLFFDDSEFYAVALESGNMGQGKTERDALIDLVVLVEDELVFRASGKYQVTTLPAQDKYIKAFVDLHKRRKLTPPKIKTPDLDEIAKRLKPLLNPKNPKNYQTLQYVA